MAYTAIADKRNKDRFTLKTTVEIAGKDKDTGEAISIVQDREFSVSRNALNSLKTAQQKALADTEAKIAAIDSTVDAAEQDE